MSHYATRAYANVGVNTSVESASPHKLVLMLYDGLLKQLRIAKVHIERKEIAPKAAAISKALAIVDQGLRPGLDLEKGGSIAAQLLALYDYSGERLLQANLRNDAAAIEEVIQLIEPIRSAWAQINPDANAATQGAAR
ncbi:MAG TPA: flagellar export chaperone FliS [Polyangiales bacterium]|nr:flagellar export chaperone FliS [Polyangiales bacterium]